MGYLCLARTTDRHRRSVQPSRSCVANKVLSCVRTLVLAGVLVSVPVEGGDEPSIPETPVQPAGEIGLIFQGQVELALDERTPTIGSVSWMRVSPDSSLLLVDRVGQEAHEFSLLDGRYIRSFGRKGAGPGEYTSPITISVDPTGFVYLLHSAGVIRYDRLGNYLDQWTGYDDSRALTGREGELFVLGREGDMKVSRLDPATWEMSYHTPVSTDRERFLTARMGRFYHLCYSTSRHRLYYLGVNDYHVKEIDATTGEITRRFGFRPKGFTPLPERFHDVGTGSRELIQEVMSSGITFLKSMTLFQDRFLLVSHHALVSNHHEWAIYDLEGASTIKVYGLTPDAEERMRLLANRMSWNSIAAWEERLCIWKSPPEEESETSNGTIELYGITLTSGHGG